MHELLLAFDRIPNFSHNWIAACVQASRVCQQSFGPIALAAEGWIPGSLLTARYPTAVTPLDSRINSAAINEPFHRKHALCHQ